MQGNRLEELGLRADAAERGGWAKAGIAAFYVANAATTALYGAVLGENMFASQYAALNMMLGALYLLLLFDVGAIVWELADLHLAEANGQRYVAQTMKVASFVASLATSAAYVASYSGLWIPSPAQLASMQWLVWLLATSAVVAQAAAGGLFLALSVMHREASRAARQRIALRNRYFELQGKVLASALDDAETAFAEKYQPILREQLFAGLTNDMLDSLGYSEHGAQELRKLPVGGEKEEKAERRPLRPRMVAVPVRENGHGPAREGGDDAPLSSRGRS